MILYHAFTTYHLLEFIVHKLNYENEDAILLYPEVLYNKFRQIDTLMESIFIKTVQIYTSTRDGIKTITNYDALVKEIGELEDYTKIHIAGAQTAFAFWLVERNIPFYFWEEANGILSRPQILRDNDKRIDIRRYTLSEKYGLYTGENYNIESIYCNTNAQIKGWHRDNVTNFDVMDEIYKLSKKNRKILIDFFRVPKINGNEGTLILTQHFTNIKRLTYQEQKALYLSTCDFFLEKEKIYFKLHPDDCTNYKDVISTANVITDKFPSELIPLINEKTCNWKIATISSRGIGALESYFKSKIGFNTDYEISYVDNPIYYFLVRLLGTYFSNYKILSSVNTVQLKNMCIANNLMGVEKNIYDYIDKNDILNNNDKPIIHIMGKKEVEINYKTNDIYIFTHINTSMREIMRIDKKIRMSCRLIEFVEKNQKKYFIIYFLYRDDKVRDFIMDFNLSKELYFSKNIIRSGPLNNLEEKNICLNGQLEVAEKYIKRLEDKLTELIEENKQLMEKNKEY